MLFTGIFFVLFVVTVIVSIFLFKTEDKRDIKLKWAGLFGSILTALAYILLPLVTFDTTQEIENNLHSIPGSELYLEITEWANIDADYVQKLLADFSFSDVDLETTWQIISSTPNQSLTSLKTLFNIPVFEPTFHFWLGLELAVAVVSLIALIIVLVARHPGVDRVLTYLYGGISALALIIGVIYLPSIEVFGAEYNFSLTFLSIITDTRVGGAIWFILAGNLFLVFNPVLQYGLGWVGQKDELDIVFDFEEARWPSVLASLLAAAILIVTVATFLYQSNSYILTTDETSVLAPETPAAVAPSPTITVTVSPPPTPLQVDSAQSAPTMQIATPAPSDTPASQATLVSTNTPATVSPSPTLTILPRQDDVKNQVDNDVVMPPEVEELQELMLSQINRDRSAEGVSPVVWSRLAAYVAKQHAIDMAENDFFSHWNMSGLGPDHRYSQAGGKDTVAENIHLSAWIYDDGTAAPVNDWHSQVITAQLSLMDSPPHRKTILEPAHTHVGVGMAYNTQTGRFYVAQEFISRYVQIETLPSQAAIGDQLTWTGELLMGSGVSNPLINLAYEPFPSEMTTAQLAKTGSYQSEAEFFEAIQPEIVSDQTYSADIVLDYNGQPGYYHVRTWVDHPDFADRVLVSDIVVKVQ